MSEDDIQEFVTRQFEAKFILASSVGATIPSSTILTFWRARDHVALAILLVARKNKIALALCGIEMKDRLVKVVCHYCDRTFLLAIL